MATLWVQGCHHRIMTGGCELQKAWYRVLQANPKKESDQTGVRSLEVKKVGMEKQLNVMQDVGALDLWNRGENVDGGARRSTTGTLSTSMAC